MILAIQMCEWNFDKAVGKEMTRAKAQRTPSLENKRFFKNITAEAQDVRKNSKSAGFIITIGCVIFSFAADPSYLLLC